MKYAALFLAAALVSTGCFTYVPVEPAAVRPNEEVRVRITEQAALRVAPQVGRFTSEIEAELTPASEDSLTLSVWVGRDYRGTAFENVHQTFAVGRNEVLEIRRRQLDKPKTFIMGAGVVAVFAILIDRIVLVEDPNPANDGNPPPPPPQAPLGIRIPVGWFR